MELLQQYKKYLIVAIMLLAAVLIFTRLTLFDIQTDDATYSFRALGYFDYMHSNMQSTPVMWFNGIPAWSRLSFHDAPPLVFIVQYLFFLISESVLFAKLPFALAGLATVYLMYGIGKEWHSARAGMLVAGTLAVSSYGVWASRIGYLEPMVTVWSLLALLAFIKAQRNSRWYWVAGLSLAAALLSKYTAAYIIPVLATVWWAKQYGKHTLRPITIRMVGAVLVLFLPVIIYNIAMYKARGHFDLQFARLLGQDLSDWPTIANNLAERNYVASAIEFWKVLFFGYSAPLFFATIVSGIWLVIDAIRKRSNAYVPLAIAFACLWLGLTIVGPEPRFVSIVVPWMALVLGIGASAAYDAIGSQKIWRVAGGISIGAILSYELFFAINTNLLKQPVGEKGKQYSSYRQRVMGFGELETYLDATYNLSSLPRRSVHSLDDLRINQDTLSGRDIFIYDSGVKWFSTLWYFSRWAIYRDVSFISVTDLAAGLGTVPKDWITFFDEKGVRNVHYIAGIHTIVSESGKGNEINDRSTQLLRQIFTENGATEHLITNKNNQTVFGIYTISLN